MSYRHYKRAEGYSGGPDLRQHGGRTQGPISATAQSLSGSAVHVVFARIADAAGRPVRGARYEVVGPSRLVVAEGTTSLDGVVRHEVAEPGGYNVRVLDAPGSGGSAGDPAGAIHGGKVE